MRQKLPPPNALRIFEVAARAGSYSAAAKELNLTHGAVSRQIAILEEWLGQPLFFRDGQSMAASPHARALAREITAAFDHIADAAERYGKSRHLKVIRVSASATVAMRWLIPQLPSFAERCPDVDVRVSTVMSTEAALRGSFDMAIRREVPSSGQYQTWPLFRESNTVIASPALILRSGVKTVEQLSNETWLTSETRPGDWEAWVKAAGCPTLRANRTLRFDHFFVTLQAVSDALGFGIGPFPTLEADCASGRLQTPFPELWSLGSTYYALISHDADVYRLNPVNVARIKRSIRVFGLNAGLRIGLTLKRERTKTLGRPRHSTPLAMLRRMIAMRTSLRNGFGFEIENGPP